MDYGILDYTDLSAGFLQRNGTVAHRYLSSTLNGFRAKNCQVYVETVVVMSPEPQTDGCIDSL